MYPVNEEQLTDSFYQIAKYLGHELRTLIAAIDCGINSAKDSISACENTTYLPTGLELASKANSNAASLLSNFLLNLSNLKNHNLSCKCSIRECLEISINQFPYKSNTQRHFFPKEIDRELDFNFLGNKYLIVNLLFNIFNFLIYRAHDSENQNIKISYEKQINKNNLFISADVNVTADEISKLFELNYGLQNAHIALSFVFNKRLMYALQGDISCIQTSDNSLNFTISFPVIT